MEAVARRVAYNSELEIRHAWRNLREAGQQIGEVLVWSNPAHVQEYAPVHWNPSTLPRGNSWFAGSDRMKERVNTFTDHIDAVSVEPDVIHNFSVCRIRDRDDSRCPPTGESHLQRPQQTSLPTCKN